MKHPKVFFFTGIDGPTGHVFRTENRPRRVEYEHLFDSLLFRLDAADSAQELEAGHIRLETDTRAKGRALPIGDGFQRAILAHQLPVIRNDSLIGDVLINTITANGIIIDEVDYVNGGRVRRDYIVKNGLSLMSPGGTIALVPVNGGYEIDVAAGISDTFKVKSDVADMNPDYLDGKVGNGLSINTIGHKMFIMLDPSPAEDVVLSLSAAGLNATLNHINTNTLQLITGVGGLYGNVRYNGLYFTENTNGLTIVPSSITGSLIALNTITNNNFATSAFGDGIINGSSYVYANVGYSVSLIGSSPNKVIGLVNDVLNPGNNYYYGTNNAGIKGWYNTSIDKWDYHIGNDDVSVRNTNSETKAPRTVATGSYSQPWLYGALGNAGHNMGQSMRVNLHAVKTNSDKLLLKTADGMDIWLPNDCSAFINGIIIVSDVVTGEYATFKVSCSARKFSSNDVELSDILYDTPTTPFHILQGSSSPYALPYTNTFSTTNVDFRIEVYQYKINLVGISGDITNELYYDAFIDIFIQGYNEFDISNYPLY